MPKCIPVLRMQYWVRRVLSTPLDTLYVSHGRPVSSSDVGSMDVCVGDIVSDTMDCRVRVYDYATRRKVLCTRETSGEYIVYNPRSTISIGSRNLLYTSHRDIAVIGEEDLLTLLYTRSKYKSIVYGQPGVGVVVVYNDKYFKTWVTKLLKTFKPDIVCIDGEYGSRR